ncbi:MAG: DUF1343 domain-containing protein [Proteobacteria bacterium]|nr:DUF1343 domain-containing protein [Pseudomonadota bacterium]
MPVLTGIDVLEKNGFNILKNAKVGVVVNPASANRHIEPTLDLLLKNGIKVNAIFAPQHGLYAETQDNMKEWEGFIDKRTGLSVYSLYGKVRKPRPEMMKEIDALIFDLPDVGARYYTFIWTLGLCMQACAEQGKKMIILDRPNPINGIKVEGPVLNPEFSSFVGMYPIAVRHGMTVGELARMFNEEFEIGCPLAVVKMEGWERKMWFDDTGLPWVMPSPNMPTPDSATVYPGMCLLEGTNLSEGRGTTRPFEIFGAPWLDPYLLKEILEREDLPGASFRPLCFVPTFNKWRGELCGGIQIHVTDREQFLPFETALAIVKHAKELHPDSFRWSTPPYEYEEIKLPFDIIAGTDTLRKTMNKELKEICQSWQKELTEFKIMREKYLLYG